MKRIQLGDQWSKYEEVETGNRGKQIGFLLSATTSLLLEAFISCLHRFRLLLWRTQIMTTTMTSKAFPQLLHLPHGRETATRQKLPNSMTFTMRLQTRSGRKGYGLGGTILNSRTGRKGHLGIPLLAERRYLRSLVWPFRLEEIHGLVSPLSSC